MPRAVNHSASERGTVSVMVAMTLLPLMLFLAVVADAGRVWIARVALQNGVDAAANSVADSWVRGGPACTSTQMDLLSAGDASPASRDCTVTGTNRMGTVKVQATQNVALLFGSLVGRESAVTSAATTVKVAPVSSLRGVWPLALCAEHPAVQAWLASGLTSTASWSIMFDSTAVLCGSSAGNWAVLDFNGGSNSNSETKSWVSGGYSELVSVGDVIPGNTGLPSGSIGLSEMPGNDVLIALFDSVSGTGSGSAFRIVGFTAAHVISVTLDSASSGRNLTIRFVRDVLSGETGNNTNYGISTWKVCAQDGFGVCQ